MDDAIDPPHTKPCADENLTPLHRWLIPLILLAMTALLYGPVAGNQFLNWDDADLLTQNTGLNPATWRSVARFWREPYEGLYSPLSYSLWAALTRVARSSTDTARPAGLNPHIFHTANLVLHLA